MRSSPPRSALLLLLLLLAIAAVGCRSAGGESAESESEGAADDDDSGEEEPATSVRVSTLKTGPIARTIASSATIEAARRADIHLEVAGTIESVLHEEGDLVAAGEVLALLRNPALAGELERAEASHERARQDFASVESLYGQGFVSRNEYEASSHALQTARVTLDQARESHRARQIRSPIVGTLSTRAVRFGEAVSPGALAFQVVDLSSLEVNVRLPEKDLLDLRVGQEVRVRSEVVEGVEPVTGRVGRLSPVVDPSTGTFKVTIHLDPEQDRLRPGMFVNVEVVVETHEAAVLMPKRALVFEDSKSVAFVVRDGIVGRVSLQTGFEDGEVVEVLDGLSSGEQVVIVGQGLLKDGSAVQVVE